MAQEKKIAEGAEEPATEADSKAKTTARKNQEIGFPGTSHYVQATSKGWLFILQFLGQS